MATLPSACPLDCPDACSLAVTVQDGRVRSVRAGPGNPLTDGFICAKVASYPEHLYGSDRVLRPLRRVGPKGSASFEPIGWDEALDHVADRLGEVRDQHGGEAILPCSYGGSNGMLSEGAADARLFARLGATRLHRALCAAPSGAAQQGLYGKMPGTALQDAAHAELVVVWGCNPSATGVHLLPPLRAARRRGAKLVVVDPRRIPIARGADLHLAPRPGTDLPVALALIGALFERGLADEAFLAAHTTGAEELRRRAAPWTLARAAEISGVPLAHLDRLVTWYAAASPALIRCGWGVERNRNGGGAVAAILALPAVAGKFGMRGGGYAMSSGRAWRFDKEAALGVTQPTTREVGLVQLGAALTRLAPPIRALFVYNCNPLATVPDQEQVRAGLLRDDLFTVVHEQVLTDTARYADVVLPATTFLEHDDLTRGYGAYVAHRIRPVIAPVGEARPNLDVFTDLLDRLGLSRPGEPRSADAVANALVHTLDDAARVAAALTEGPAAPSCGFAPVPFVDVWPNTPDRRVHLVPEALDAAVEGGLYRYAPDPGTGQAPLALISPATGRTISSTFGQLHRAPEPLVMHPDDARVRDLTDGAQVRVHNHLGEVRCALRISDEVRPGVVTLPKGLWLDTLPSGTTSNALIPDTLADLGGGACFNDARVQVSAAGAPERRSAASG